LTLFFGFGGVFRAQGLGREFGGGGWSVCESGWSDDIFILAGFSGSEGLGVNLMVYFKSAS